MKTPDAIIANREINFSAIRRAFLIYQEHCTLSEAEVIGAGIKALEQWEACGGRQWIGFHMLLDSILEAMNQP